MKKISPKALARSGMIAALYTVISVALLPMSFGAVQVRVAEALTLLPVLTPLAIPGVTLGCIITNAYGVAAGANILGAADIFIGSSATLIAALLTYALRNLRTKGLPILASLPPVIVNAVIIGAELSFAETNSLFSPLFFINALQVGMGQFISCTILGTALIWAIERAGLKERFSL